LFRAEYGKKFHNVIDTLTKKGNNSAEYHKAVEDLWKVLQAGKARIPYWDGLGNTSLSATINFLKSLPDNINTFDQVYLSKWN